MHFSTHESSRNGPGYTIDDETLFPVKQSGDTWNDFTTSFGLVLGHVSSLPLEKSTVEEVKAKYSFQYTSEDELSPQAKPDGALDEIRKVISTAHSYNEEALHLIKSGTCTFLVLVEKEKWVKVTCSPGDIVILKPNVVHKFLIPKSKECKLIMIGMYKVPEDTIQMKAYEENE
eukprot:g6472.t1